MTLMTHASHTRRWSRDEFLRAWEAGEFEHRVELIDGEVWPVSIGRWHGPTTVEVASALRHPSVVVTTETLPSGESLPDPDCWVRRRGDAATCRPVHRACTTPGDKIPLRYANTELSVDDLIAPGR
jgi:Uma2 family endonuclease